jgi:hypothetical protein
VPRPHDGFIVVGWGASSIRWNGCRDGGRTVVRFRERYPTLSRDGTARRGWGTPEQVEDGHSWEVEDGVLWVGRGWWTPG